MADRKNSKLSRAFDFQGPVYTWGSKAFDVVLLTVYWVAGSLPLVTIGTSAAALYYATDRSVLEDRDTATESFWRSYRKNLKMGTAHWLLSLALGFVFLLNFGICRAKMTGHMQWIFCALYLVLTAFLIMNACYVFPMVARYDMPFGWYLRGSLYCVFRYFPVSLFLLAMIAAGYYAVYRFPLTILFIPGLYSVITVPSVRKRILQFGPPDQEEEEEPEQDEME